LPISDGYRIRIEIRKLSAKHQCAVFCCCGQKLWNLFLFDFLKYSLCALVHTDLVNFSSYVLYFVVTALDLLYYFVSVSDDVNDEL